MSYQAGNTLFTVELLVGSLIFLFAAEKRKWFYLWLTAVFFGCPLLVWFMPMHDQIFYSLVGTLVKNLAIMGLTILGMGLCFRLPFRGLFSACVSGYAVQHIAFQTFMLLRHFSWAKAIVETGITGTLMIQIPVDVIIYAVCLVTLGRFVARHKCYQRVDGRIVSLAFLIIMIGIGLRRVTQYFNEWESITIPLYAIVSCILALTIQYILFLDMEKQRENEAIQLMWQEERKQYQISKENQELLHIKYHDWKHQLLGFQGKIPQEEIRKMEEAMKTYEGMYDTGNEALDVVLTQFHWRCLKRGISMNFAGNGKMLPEMEVTDIYSLFGNAIENAMEAVEREQDPEKRVIDIFLDRKGDLTVVEVSNYYNGNIRMTEGLPVSSKKEEGFHGFGVKSMKQITEKYGGGMSVSVEKDEFHLRFWLMDGFRQA